MDGYDYDRVLREVAARAEGAISSIYDDLQRRKDALIAIPESDRKKLAKQVNAFYDGNGMGGGFWQKRCATTNGRRDGLSNALMFGSTPYVRVDPPHNGQGYHIKIDSKFLGQNEIYDWIYKKLEHYPLTEDAYHFLKNLDNVQKVVKIAGRILLVTGLALDVLEIGLAIYDDLHDADGKIGKKTLSMVVSIGGSWGGAKLGAKAGASLGAAANVAAPVVVPVLSLTEGIAGSYLGSALGKWVVDITYAGD